MMVCQPCSQAPSSSSSICPTNLESRNNWAYSLFTEGILSNPQIEKQKIQTIDPLTFINADPDPALLHGMIFIFYGCSLHYAQIWSKPEVSTWCWRLFGYIEGLVKSDFFSEKTYFTSCLRNMFWATILYKYHDSDCLLKKTIFIWSFPTNYQNEMIDLEEDK